MKYQIWIVENVHKHVFMGQNQALVHFCHTFVVGAVGGVGRGSPFVLFFFTGLYPEKLAMAMFRILACQIIL